jgi:hypothetical protein
LDWRECPMKLEAEDILEEIADELILYLKAGNISINSFINKLNFNINNLPQLLRIHFVLNEEVIKFIEELPENLRRIKTSTRNIVEVLNAKIKGRINWPDTFRERYKINYLDRIIYSCIQRDRNFNIKENLVLKRLLKVIIEILSEDINLSKNYNWLDRWTGEGRLFYRLQDIYSRNIYLNRIDTSGINITDRMVNDTMKSRNRLYRRAAELLALYRRLTQPACWQDERINEKIKELLQKTFVQPDNESVLFELYWAFKILRNFERVKYNIIDGHDNLVAFWEDQKCYYRLYHDSDGSSKIKFRVELSEIRDSNNEYLERMYRTRIKHINLVREIFGKGKDTAYWQGRPDIILEVTDKETDEIKRLYIGEVKNTTNKEYALEGLKELLEYMVLIKDRYDYINTIELNEDKVLGLLCLNDVRVKNGTIDNNITVLNAANGDIELKLN